MRPALVLYGLRVARARQLRARALRPLRRRRFRAGPAPVLQPVEGPLGLWQSAAFAPVQLAGSGRERLREFHSHYGDDVLAAARAGEQERARAAIERWLDEQPPRAVDAWHPYPTSTRVGNWLAALALLPDLASPRLRESLWQQVHYVLRNVENDVLGNHVIRNARALALGGAAFGAEELLAQAATLLERELADQVLADGGHYERSPVYHLVVLRDLLEIEAAVQGSVPSELLERMRRFSAALARPDGQPALFNDGTLDLAPKLDLPDPDEGLSVFANTGYAVVRSRRLWLAFDCGPPSPAYLPAHAHADALSFQLWVDGVPVVVDPGMSTYEQGEERDWFRGTRAHSTVAVGGDQFELWGAFRSGPLPRVRLLDAQPTLLGAEALYRGIRHVRRISIESDHVLVRDTIQGAGSEEVESALPLAPSTDLSRVEAEGAMSVEQRVLAERLYVREPAPALVQRRRGRPAELGWRIRF